ncbi:hypothetical protein PILCRDRAFT_5774 [Piloderma croceum F 1598]|uniref:BZIP domain-containing protein n=1 Tax=Piloderma croceum (strain F 1598) TaxID=765440 RepID=A0A0C3G495_PILCF|nr:hypothetical protein PILCRDRAFT_5774 [Piloderma croceum F 1598]
MPVLKTENLADTDLTTNCAQAGLDHWGHLIFSFDMDKGSVNRTGNTNPRNARSPRSAGQSSTAATGSNERSSRVASQNHDVLAQAAATAGPGGPNEMSFQQFAYTLQSMHEPQGNYPYIPPAPNFRPNYLPPDHMGPHIQGPPHPYAWAQHPLPHPSQGQYDLQHSQYHDAGPFPYGASSQQQLPPISTNIRPRAGASTAHTDASVSPSVSPTDTMDQTEESSSITEDKRRRNTAASARFRIKKKQRSLNLDRSVSDLTGRAEELEREATELRRENGWLKEIVMLKGRSLSGATRSTEGREGSGDGGDTSDDEDSGIASKNRSKIKGKGKGKANK